jgi:beta-hydroxylase
MKMMFILTIFNLVFTLTSKIQIQAHYDDISMLYEAVLIKLNYHTFRREAENIYKRLNTIDGDMFFEGLSRKKNDWSRLYLKWFDKVDPLGEQLCPQSLAIIREIPGVKIAMLSVLKPGAKILPHKGPYRGCIRLHMGLITPNSDECFINIDGKSYSWRDGEVLLLDDSYEHYVENNTDKYRVILFCDILRPMNFVGDTMNDFLVKYMAKYTHRYN